MKNRDKVERDIVLRAPIERAFAALTDPSLFPTWGPERIEGTLAPGERPVLDFGPGGKCAVYVVAVEAPRYFAYRWKQGVTDPAILLGDPLAGPSTLVEFRLEETDGGTRVRVIESGLSDLPMPAEVNIDEAIEHMGEGWQLMLGGLGRHFDNPDRQPGDRLDAEKVVRGSRQDVFAALAWPVPWLAQSIDRPMTPGEVPLLDFGMFGAARLFVVAVEPPQRLAFRWVQGVDDPARRAEDPRTAPSTLVEITVDDAPDGARVRVAESGFEALPGDWRAHFRRAAQGWGTILGMLELHLAKR